MRQHVTTPDVDRHIFQILLFSFLKHIQEVKNTILQGIFHYSSLFNIFTLARRRKKCHTPCDEVGDFESPDLFQRLAPTLESKVHILCVYWCCFSVYIGLGGRETTYHASISMNNRYT